MRRRRASETPSPGRYQAPCTARSKPGVDVRSFASEPGGVCEGTAFFVTEQKPPGSRRTPRLNSPGLRCPMRRRGLAPVLRRDSLAAVNTPGRDLASFFGIPLRACLRTAQAQEILGELREQPGSDPSNSGQIDPALGPRDGYVAQYDIGDDGIRRHSHLKRYAGPPFLQLGKRGTLCRYRYRALRIGERTKDDAAQPCRECRAHTRHIG